jgi:hypothetical protein
MISLLTKSTIVVALLAPLSTLHAGDSDAAIQSAAEAPAEYWQNKDSHLALQISLLTEAGLAAD